MGDTDLMDSFFDTNMVKLDSELPELTCLIEEEFRRRVKSCKSVKAALKQFDPRGRVQTAEGNQKAIIDDSFHSLLENYDLEDLIPVKKGLDVTYLQDKPIVRQIIERKIEGMELTRVAEIVESRPFLITFPHMQLRIINLLKENSGGKCPPKCIQALSARIPDAVRANEDLSERLVNVFRPHMQH